MDGEQKNRIPLDSQLDINSNDMLVPAGQPKFAFNRQKYLGSLLKNSVRYEADGWFAGWWGHNFNYQSKGNNYITPELGDPSQLTIVNSTTEKGTPYIQVNQQDANVEITFNNDGWSQWSAGSGTVIRTSDDVVTISGATSKGDTFSVTTDPYTGNVKTFTSPNPELVATSNKVGDIYSLKIGYNAPPELNYITIRKGKNITFLMQSVAYSYSSNTNRWGTVFNMNNAGVLSIPTALADSFQIVSQQVNYPGTTIENTEAVIRTIVSADIKYTFNLRERWYKDKFVSVDIPSNGVADSGKRTEKHIVYDEKDKYVSGINPLNWQEVKVAFTRTTPIAMDRHSSIRYAYAIPIWLKFWAGFGVTSNAEMVVVPELPDPPDPDSEPPTSIRVVGDVMLDLTEEIQASIHDIINDNAIIKSYWEFKMGAGGTWTNIDQLPYAIGTINASLPVPAKQPGTPIFEPPLPPEVAPITYNFDVYVRCCNGNQNYPFATDSAVSQVLFEFSFAYSKTFYFNWTDTHHVFFYWYGVNYWKFSESDAVITRKGFRWGPVVDSMRDIVDGKAGNYGGIRNYDMVLESWDEPPITSVEGGIGFQIRVPMCVEALTIVRVNTLELHSQNVDSFEVETIKNSDVPIKCFRLDDGGGEGIGDWALDDLIPEVANVSTDAASTVNQLVQVKFDSMATNYYYCPDNGSKNAWPGFAVGHDDSLNMLSFVVSGDSPYVQNVKVSIQKYRYFEDRTVDLTINNENEYNRSLAGVLMSSTMQLEYIEDYSKQTVKIIVDAVGKEWILLEWSPGTMTQKVLETHFEDYEFISYTGSRKNGDNQLGLLKIKVKREDPLIFYRTFIYAKLGLMLPVNMVSQEASNIVLTSGYGTVDLGTGSLIGATQVVFAYSQITADTIKLFVQVANNADLLYLPKGMFYRNSDAIKYISNYVSNEYVCIFEYNGTQYTVHIDKESSQTLIYSTVDIRNGEYKEVYSRSASDMYMYIKQFWSSTVDVENFWWIDETHVIELSKYYATLYVKVANEVHDWMGDRWNVEQRVPRHYFVQSSDLYYNVSSAYNSKPALFKLQNVQENLVISYIADIVAADFNNLVWTDVTVPVKSKAIELGTKLDNNAISSYVGLNTNALIGASEITSTVADGTFLIGIKANRGLQQWVLKISGTTFSVIIGYGSVGLNGSLTGGQIPKICCDDTGFKEIVYPLSDIPATSSLDSLPDKCYGTPSQVWFIYKNAITSIISHMTFARGVHTPVELKLNNNVQSEYESTSFKASYLQDLLPQVITLGDLLAGTDGMEAMSLISAVALPSAYIIAAKYSFCYFIGHSLGQYAYVWYNSTSDSVKDKISDQDEFFCNVEFPVHWRDTLSTIGKWLLVILKGVDTMPEPPVYKVNEAQNQTSPSDEGRKYTNFAIDTLITTAVSGFSSSGSNSTMSSVLKAKYSLPMFYSVSDKTECWAGPGFVHHSLTGQCLAQSSTDIQLDAKRYSYFSVLKGLSSVILQAQIYVDELAIKGLENTANDVAGLVIDVKVLGSGSGIPVGQVTAAILRVAATVLWAHLQILYLAQEHVLPMFLNMLGSEEGKCSMLSQFSKRSVMVEGTHNYGSKPMAFFWPCFGIDSQQTYTDESVGTTYNIIQQEMNLAGIAYESSIDNDLDEYATLDFNKSFAPYLTPNINPSGNPDNMKGFKGVLTTPYIICKGSRQEQTAPANMAVVEGVQSFLGDKPFKNEQVGVTKPQWPAPPFQDYMIDETWGLSFMATMGIIVWTSQDDVKLIDGPPSNIVVKGTTFCGVASSYTAIEIKKGFDKRYLRPFAVTPNCIALNINRINCVHDAKAYHAFDGQGNRIVNWHGGTGMDKVYVYKQYAFQINDYFKRSNILPASEFMGVFTGPPVLAVRSYDRIANLVSGVAKGDGSQGAGGIPGEDKDLRRYSIPVHSEEISTLPAMVRMLGPYKLSVVDGVTCLITDIRNTNTMYKAPSSIDFNIDGKPYRATSEYIGDMQQANGVVAVTGIVPIAGLTFLGATTKEAYFYSAATRMYYSFGGGRDITKRDIFNRFRDLKDGKWDFVNQEVMFKCLLGNDVLICRLDGQVLGEVYPPNKTVYSERSDFKLLSMPGGLTYQGPKRFAVNRFIINEHMYPDLRDNKRRWTRVSRYEYNPERDYGWEYEDLDTRTPLTAVYGWVHNPFRLVTSMLGTDEETDSRFEWDLTFAWTENMDMLYEKDEYATVNIMAETVTQGGTKFSEVTHVFLFKECFTREGCAGYYTYQFQSNNGIGNRERLYIWSDSLIALEDLQQRAKQMTGHRMNPAFTQIDVKDLKEQ